jgi:hypothetical protein
MTRLPAIASEGTLPLTTSTKEKRGIRRTSIAQSGWNVVVLCEQDGE